MLINYHKGINKTNMNKKKPRPIGRGFHLWQIFVNRAGTGNRRKASSILITRHKIANQSAYGRHSAYQNIILIDTRHQPH